MRRDPHRVNKDELLHKLHQLHKGTPVGDLDVGDMAAGHMLLQQQMKRDGVVLTVGETADMLGEMAHAIGGNTRPAGEQFAEELDTVRRKKRAGMAHNRRMDKTRQMLTRKKER